MACMNWSQLIRELSERGVTQKEIADYCGCGQSTVSELLRGEIKEPSWSIGSALTALHAEQVGTANGN